MSAAGGYSWDEAGLLDLTGSSQPTVPNPVNVDGNPHPTYWKFTPTADGMIVLDTFASDYVGSPDTYIDVYSGPDWALAVEVGWGDDALDPDLPDIEWLTKMSLFVQAGVEYHVIAGVWDTPPTSTVPQLVLRSRFYPNGPGVPGATWDDAGVIDVGKESRPLLVDDFGSGQYWFKFTPSFSGWCVFDSESKSTRSYAGRGFGGAEVTLYSGDSFDDKTLLGDWESRYPEGFDSGIFLGLGAFQVVAGTEYHLRVQGIYDMWEVHLAVSQAAFGAFVQDDDFEIGNYAQPYYDGSEYVGLGQTIGRESTNFRSGDVADNTLRAAYANTELGTLDGLSPSASAFDYGGAVTTTHTAQSTQDRNGFGAPISTTTVATAQVTYVGMPMSPFADDVTDWEYFEARDPDAAAIDYDNGDVAAWNKTEIQPTRRVFRASGYTGESVGSQIELSLSPDPSLGSGRVIHSEAFSGDPGFPATATDLGRFEVDPGDFANTDHIVWIIPSLPTKSDEWAFHATTSDLINAEILVNFGGPFDGGGSTILRWDTFTPPQRRWVFAGPTTPYADSVFRLDPVRRIYPRAADDGPGIGRNYPPSTSPQTGWRGGSTAPV